MGRDVGNIANDYVENIFVIENKITTLNLTTDLISRHEFSKNQHRIVK